MLILMGFFLLGAYRPSVTCLRLHTLPERLARTCQKLPFEIVAVALLALFTHNHVFWLAGLILVLIDLPDWPHCCGGSRAPRQ